MAINSVSSYGGSQLVTPQQSASPVSGKDGDGDNDAGSEMQESRPTTNMSGQTIGTTINTTA